MNIILLSGGSGKRLWPLSNEVRSKQFLKIFKREDGSHESMVQRMYRMIKEVDGEAEITVATSDNQVFSIKNQLGSNVGISIEPCRRDTFAAIALATAYLHDVQGVPEDVLEGLVLAMDVAHEVFGALGKVELRLELDDLGIRLAQGGELPGEQAQVTEVRGGVGGRGNVVWHVFSSCRSRYRCAPG